MKDIIISMESDMKLT